MMRAIRASRPGVVLACAGAMLWPAGALAAETTSRQFIATGESLFIVPAGVTSLHVTLVGGAGGASLGGGPHGGSGALVSANLAVTPGESLFA